MEPWSTRTGRISSTGSDPWSPRESGSWEPERALRWNGRGCSRRRRLRRPRERGWGLWGRVRRRRWCRIGARFERLLEPASKSLDLAVAAIEAVDYLQKDLVLVHQVVHQRLQLLLGLDVELVLALGPEAVAVGQAVQGHQYH